MDHIISAFPLQVFSDAHRIQLRQVKRLLETRSQRCFPMDIQYSQRFKRQYNSKCDHQYTEGRYRFFHSSLSSSVCVAPSQLMASARDKPFPENILFLFIIQDTVRLVNKYSIPESVHLKSCILHHSDHHHIFDGTTPQTLHSESIPAIFKQKNRIFLKVCCFSYCKFQLHLV